MNDMNERLHYNPVDAEVVGEMKPCQCGGIYCYEGIQTGDTYRAYAVCPACDDRIEI